MISRALASLVGAVLFLYGLIAAFSPLPLGAPLVVLGFLIITGANPAARPLLRRLRRKWRWFDALVVQVGKRSPERFNDVLHETAPNDNNVRAERENKTKDDSSP